MTRPLRRTYVRGAVLPFSVSVSVSVSVFRIPCFSATTVSSYNFKLHNVHNGISLSQQVKALIGLKETVKTRVLTLIT